MFTEKEIKLLSNLLQNTIFDYTFDPKKKNNQESKEICSVANDLIKKLYKIQHN
jgi:hypothetical protein